MGFGYIGVVGWSLALLVFRPGSRRGIKEFVLMALVIFGLGTAMGLPVFRAVQEALPGIRLAPPLRFLLLAAAGGAALAALELDRLLKDAASRKSALWPFVWTCLFIAAMALLVFFRLRSRHEAVGGLGPQTSALVLTLAVLFAGVALSIGFIRGRVIGYVSFSVLLTGLAALELLHQGMRLYRFYSPADLYPETPLIRYLKSRPPPYRIVSDGGALFPNTNIFAGAESVGTHDPSERRDYVEILDLTAGYPPFEYFKSIRNLNAPILDFLNARYLISSPGRLPPSEKWRTAYSGADGTVLENLDVLPRFFAPARVQRVTPVPGRDPRIDALAAFGQPLRDLLANGSLRNDALVLGGSRETAEQIANGSVLISDIEQTTNRIRFHAEVTKSERAILVSSVVNDGGWSASDGQGRGIPVVLANGPFVALVLPAGAQNVTLTYRPLGLYGGAFISLTSLVLAVACLLWRLRFLHARRPVDPPRVAAET